MGKIKSKSRSSGKSARLSKKIKTRHEIKLNPFEVRTNRRKHDVLGQKIEKSEQGIPGVSRSRAIEKRKRTLLKEYRNRNKFSSLTDKRFGESDKQLSHEEKMLQRQIQQAKKRHQKASIFNLEDDADLTHYGQSIGTIDSFDDLQLSTDEDNEFDDTDTHFGGFLKKKSHQEQSSTIESSSSKEKTRKQVIDDIVAKSKLYKHERQKEKEKVDELLEAVDSQWTNIQSLLNRNTKSNRNSKEALPTNTTDNDFDRYLKELESEPRAAATERLKTDEETAQIQELKMKALEQERYKRMVGETGNELTNEHSADQNTTGDKKNSDKRVMIKYNDDGDIVLPGGITSLMKNSIEDENNEDMSGDISEDEDVTGEDEDVTGDISGVTGDLSEDEDVTGDISEDVDVTGDDEDVNVTSDVGEDVDVTSDVSKDVTSDLSEADDVILLDTDAVMSKGIDLKALFNEHTLDQCQDTLDKFIVSCTSLLSKDNVKKIKVLFTCLLDYILSSTSSLTSVGMETVSVLTRSLYKCGQASPAHSAALVQKHLLNSYKRYQRLKKGDSQFPTDSDVILFKIVGILFPTSDFRHPVTTPTMHLMSISLSKSKLLSVADVVRCSAIAQMFIEYITLSKRFVPELVNYITGLLHLLSSHDHWPLPPFTSLPKKLLSLADTSSSSNQSFLSIVELLCLNCCSSTSVLPVEEYHVIRLSLLVISVKQVQQLSELWRHLSTYDIIFNPPLDILMRLREICASSICEELITSTVKSVQSHCLLLRKPILQLLKKKPKSIKFFEPSVDNDYQPGKRRYSNKNVGEKMKLKYKHKREMKGAIREIRKDNKFLAKERINQQFEKDAARKKKVNQIFGWLQQERGEARTEKIKRRKKS